MPIVTGPLFSLTARGTYRNTITFQRRGQTQTARSKPTPTGAPTPPQLATRAQIALCALTYNAQTQSTRNAWQTAAALLNSNGYAYWTQQWFAQASTPTYPPSIP